MTLDIAQKSSLDFVSATGHGGDLQSLAQRAGVAAADILDFSASINPLGPPEWLRREISRNLSGVAHYPEPRSITFRTALARTWGVTAESIVAGNGLNELLYALPRLSCVERIVIPVPAYIDYTRAANAAGRPVLTVPNSDALADSLRSGDLVICGHPANPTGELLDVPAMMRTIASPENQGVLFAIDEAFLEFVEQGAGKDSQNLNESQELGETDLHAASFLRFVAKTPNLIVLRSFTKFYAIPGLRLGCAVGAAALMTELAAALPDWSVNSLAQAIGPRLLADRSYAVATRAAVRTNREALLAGIKTIAGIGERLEIISGCANFLLLRLRESVRWTALEFAEYLLHEHQLAVRVCDNIEGLGGSQTRYLRIAVRSHNENLHLLAAFEFALCQGSASTGSADAKLTPGRETFRSARAGLCPALMLQGTSSNAGKSVMTAAFCRIFLQDGLRVAPFKAQNMSLNSYVTADGREIARAQAVQAAACRLAPDIRMSPVLLKPGSETGSQVLVNGRPVGHMSAMDYQSYKPKAFEAVRECYDSLCEDYDVIVLEGAGSPGEVNLKQNDIVNMRMAEYAEAAVLLVGDIDRGGVFAGFVGTLEVLAEWERRLVIGYLVNRFRGDARLLGDAFDYMREHTGLPILGVVPYLRGHGLPEEDSVSFKEDLHASHADGDPGATVEVLFIDLPYVSNFTDLDALRIEPDVRVRVLPIGAGPDQIGNPDAIVLPGTKNSLADLDYLKRAGFADRLVELANQVDGAVITGICGGYQMLGRSIRDGAGVESNRDTGGGVIGLGLLPVVTVFAPEKTLRQARLNHRESGSEIAGYEVHHGLTISEGGLPFFKEDVRGDSGIVREDGRVWGTYLHGVFDGDAFRRWYVDGLRTRKGLTPLGAIQATFDLEPAFERVAAAVRENVELDTIYGKLGL